MDLGYLDESVVEIEEFWKFGGGGEKRGLGGERLEN